MPIAREEWDSLQVGDTLLLRENAVELAKFKVAWVDFYIAPAQWTDNGVIISPGKRTVIEVKNSKHESLRFDYCNVVNSYMEKGDNASPKQ